MKVVERVLEQRPCKIAIVDEMQFGLMLERGTNDAEFILRRLQEEYHAKGKTVLCVLWTWRKLLTEYQGKCWNGQ